MLLLCPGHRLYLLDQLRGLVRFPRLRNRLRWLSPASERVNASLSARSDARVADRALNRRGIAVWSAAPGYGLQPDRLLLHLHDAIAQVEALSRLKLQ